MSVNIVVPTMGESVVEATVARWFKKVGDAVKIDEPVLELETDKVTLEVNAPASGVIEKIGFPQGATVKIGNVLGAIDETAAAAGIAAQSKPPAQQPQQPSAQQPVAASASSVASVSSPVSNLTSTAAVAPAAHAAAGVSTSAHVMPAARKLAGDSGINPYAIAGSGRDGRVLKEDVASALAGLSAAANTPNNVLNYPAPAEVGASGAAQPRPNSAREERVKLSRLRQRIAQRLKQAQNTAAMLTTFNEVDMSNIIALRNLHRASFEKKHGVRLGFMSFFIRACTQALREIPAVNAEIDGEEIVFRNYYDIGVAVGTEQGLVVPVIRDADRHDFAALERSVNDFGRKAREGKLSMDELTGGTFTITNGGLYGSLMSTPILNPPQSGILGMHAIKERPIAVDGKVVVRPMMYLALSYDHRLIDGREAVTFLVRVKECLETPERLLLGV